MSSLRIYISAKHCRCYYQSSFSFIFQILLSDFLVRHNMRATDAGEEEVKIVGLHHFCYLPSFFLTEFLPLGHFQ